MTFFEKKHKKRGLLNALSSAKKNKFSEKTRNWEAMIFKENIKKVTFFTKKSAYLRVKSRKKCKNGSLFLTKNDFFVRDSSKIDKKWSKNSENFSFEIFEILIAFTGRFFYEEKSFFLRKNAKKTEKVTFFEKKLCEKEAS